MITGEYPPMQGGVGAFTKILSGEMAAQGHDLFVLLRTGTQSDDPHVQLAATVQNWGAGSLVAARRWARDLRLDVVNIQYQTAAFDMSPFIHFLPDALRPTPTVTTFHDLRFPYLFPKAGKLRDGIVMRLANASNGMIATNHEDFARLKHPRLQQSHAALIPIGSNILRVESDAQAWRKQAGAADDFLIVYFGLINRSKGLETLLEALTRLNDLPVRLALVGGGAGSSDPTNAAYMREIDAQIERLGLAARIHRTEFVDDAAVSGYLAAADVVALPFADGASYRRGTLMAAIEHSCAIMTTTPQVDIPTFVDGVNMRLMPPNDANALAAALRDLHAAPETRKRLQLGAAALAQQFGWHEIAAATLDFYVRVIGANA
jgi:glycosyltransferase involved in cell wall biosynthesis